MDTVKVDPSTYYTADSSARVAAYLFDLAPFACLTWLSEKPHAFTWLGADPISGSKLLLYVSVASMVIYQTVFLKIRMATPGKIFFRLRVIDIKAPDERLSWFEAFARPLVTVLMTPFLPVFYSLALFSLERRHVADWIVGTRVVQSRIRAESKRRWLAGVALILVTLPLCLIELVSLLTFLKLAQNHS